MACVEKTCGACKQTKPISDFYLINRRDRQEVQSQCKKCMIARQKAWRIKHNEKVLKRGYERKFGITEEHINKILTKQNYLCAICKNDCRRHLNLDHCHVTNKVRGFLCDHCNKALGSFKDNIDYLEQAIAYLKEYS